MKKKKIAKAAAAAFIATSLTATVVPVYADDSTSDDVTKDESVYTVLNADGSVSEITVSDILHSEDGFDNYTDESALKDVENLKSNDPVKKTTDGYTWTTKNKDVYYQGTSTKDLPLDVNITYTLDGDEMSAADMLGKSGHVQIKINVKNKESQDYKVNGKTYHLATPFVTVAGAMLDQDKFSNVKINEGTVQSDSSHNIAAAVMVPGLRDGLKDILDDDTFKTLDSYLIDDVTIDADVKNFESPSIMLAAATSTDALKDEMSDAKLTDVFDDLDKLQDATDKLVSGTQSLYDGADELNTGAGTLNNGVSTLQNGISKLNSGASTLYSGANQVAAGATTLQNGLGQLSANSAALNSGADALAAGILATANQQLKQNDLTKNLGDLTLDNYSQLIGQVTGKDTLRASALKQVEAQIAATGTTVTDDQAKLLLYMSSTQNGHNTGTLATDLKTEGERLVKAQTVQQATAGYTGKDAVLASKNINTLLEAVRTQALAVPDSDKLSTAYATIAAQVAQAVPSLTDADQANTLVAATVRNIYTEKRNVTVADVNNQLATMTAQAKADPTEATAAIQQLITTYTATPGVNSYKNDPLYTGFAKAAYETQVKALDNSALYDKLASEIGNAYSDAQKAALIGYSADHYDTSKSLEDQLANNGKDLADALSVQSEMAAYQADNGALVNGVLDQLVANDKNAQAGIQQLTTLEDTITDVKKFVEGLKTYTAGVDSAYAGSKTLASGASQVASGASQLKDGISQLSSGAATLKSGSDALANGTTQLKSGAKTLLDGMKQYNDEGISKLTKNDKISDLKDAADLLDQVKKDGKSYDNYSGISKGTDGTVKFVYKVEGVKEEKKNTASDSDKKDNRTFFQRVADLFKF